MEKAMYLVTNDEMRLADEYTIKEQGVPSLELMERAGRALAEKVESLCPRGKILCVCGGGNNGGDGFVCARVLLAKGYKTEVLFFAERETADCAENKAEYLAVGGIIFSEIPTTLTKSDYAMAVDCLVGTGLRGGLSGQNAAAVEYLNALKMQGVTILSADIPSGLNGKTGKADGVCVRADHTLCIGEVKTGVVMADGLDFAGKVSRADIGIVLPQNNYAVWIDKQWTKERLPQRKRNSHKGTYGKAAIVAGSEEYTGAAFLSAAACARSGAGYTTLFLPEKLLPIFYLKQPEILLKSTNGGGRYAFNEENMRNLLGYDAVAYGMGMGVSEEVKQGAIYLLQHYQGKLIIDADGLNALALCETKELSALFKNAKCDVVITPHVKEFSRLCGYSVFEIEENGIEIVRQFALEKGVTVLLKSAASILTDGTNVAIHTAGNSALAKGGSGDVLSGVITGLCAMGASAYDGAGVGGFVMGKAAEKAAKYLGEYSVLAGDVIAYLGGAFLEIVQ